MPIDFFSSLIALGFMSAWLLIGQFSFIKS